VDQSSATECRFETERLQITPWHEHGGADDLAMTVTSLLTEAATRALPDDWRGAYSIDRTRQWIAERDADSTTLLASERDTDQPVGLVMLFESSLEVDRELDDVELRIGYLVAESLWGNGFASEIVSGLVSWAHTMDVPITLLAGVETGNAASIRVLTKNKFELTSSDDLTSLFSLHTSSR